MNYNLIVFTQTLCKELQMWFHVAHSGSGNTFDYACWCGKCHVLQNAVVRPHLVAIWAVTLDWSLVTLSQCPGTPPCLQKAARQLILAHHAEENRRSKRQHRLLEVIFSKSILKDTCPQSIPDSQPVVHCKCEVHPRTHTDTLVRISDRHQYKSVPVHVRWVDTSVPYSMPLFSFRSFTLPSV